MIKGATIHTVSNGTLENAEIIFDNGNIIAMASIPDFDPNIYHTYNIENFRNRVISDAYEPGSTFKIIPLALSLENNIFSLTDYLHDLKKKVSINIHLF